MGWQDAPVIGNSGAAWERAPVQDNPAIPVRDIPGALGTVAKKAAIPMIASTAGALLAGPVGAGIGGAGGEYLNQQLGITDPSSREVVINGLLPFGFGAAAKVMRPAWELGGKSGAEFVNRVAAPEARQTLARLAGPDADQYFQRAMQSGAQLDTGSALPIIQKELANLRAGTNAKTLYGRTIDILEGLESKLTAAGGKLDPKTYQAELRDLGAAMRTAEGRTINQVEAGAVKKVYGALAEGLDAEAGGAALPPQPWKPGQMLPAPSANAAPAQDLLQARQYIKRQAVLDEIEESVTKADKILRGQGENVQFNAAAVLRDLKSNPFWNGAKGERNPAFTAQEKKDLESLFTTLNKLPILKPPSSQPVGSSLVNSRIGMATGLGGSSSMAAGGDPLYTAAGAAVGLAVPTVANFARTLNIALRTETGRAELMALAKNPGATLEGIVAALSSGATEATQAKRQPPRPTTSMPTPFKQEY